MRDLQCAVYFDGKQDYIFMQRLGTFDDVRLCDDADDFKESSLEMMMNSSGIRSLSMQTADSKDPFAGELVRLLQDSVPDIKIIRQDGRSIEEVIRKYGLASFEHVPFTLPPGSAWPAHIHENTTEAFYVVKGVVAVDDGVFYEGDSGCLPPGRPHKYKNPTNSSTKLSVFFSPKHDSDDTKKVELEEEEQPQFQEISSFALQATDVPLYQTRDVAKLRYALFLSKEYGERGPISMMENLLDGMHKDTGVILEPIVMDEATGRFSSPRFPWKRSDVIKRQVTHANSVFLAGNLQSGYVEAIYRWFDKLPRMVDMYSTPELEDFIRVTEVAGDYLLGLRNVLGNNGKQPINTFFVQSRTSHNLHLKYKDRVLERCKERGINVSDSVYIEGDSDFSPAADGNTAVMVECLDRISLVMDIRQRFGGSPVIIYRGFNPIALDYYEKTRGK